MDSQTLVLEDCLAEESDWQRVVEKLAPMFSGGQRVSLKADLGAGKTSFVRHLLKFWGWSDEVPSPSFPLVLEYDFTDLKVVHIDAFRLKSAPDWDLENWSEALIFVEWPEVAGFEPQSFDFELQITVLEDARRELKVFENQAAGSTRS